MQRRCERNRRRSHRRDIRCPLHGCLIESVSQKYPLHAENPEQLLEQGIGGCRAARALLGRGAVGLENLWLEAFWCPECQQTDWYQVKKCTQGYVLAAVPPQLWKQAGSTCDPSRGNPSVSVFTLRISKGPAPAREDGIPQPSA